MRKLLNTLYVTTEDAYLSLDGETVTLKREGDLLHRLPLLNFESIVKFGYMGVSPALLGHCAKFGISVCFLSRSGRFLARVESGKRGNVLLRRQQYRLADSEEHSAEIAQYMLLAKVHNSRAVIERALRDHELRVDRAFLKAKSDYLFAQLRELKNGQGLDALRGVEGKCAVEYFASFNELILQQKTDFIFAGRSRRPPRDRVNAMLSFLYTLLVNDCAAALESVGLDPYVGFLHRDRPGRPSLAADLMEELRAFAVDRLVISLINRRQVSATDFDLKVDGAVVMSESGRKKLIVAWQEAKKSEMTHPFLEEKIPWGLVPHTQAQLLAKCVRGDLSQYPPLFWK